MKKIIGWLLLFTLFAGLFVVFSVMTSVKVALLVFGSTAIIVIWIIAAGYLIEG